MNVKSLLVVFLVSLILCLASSEENHTSKKHEEDGTTTIIAPSCEGRLALVTGATGRVGSMVTHRLLDQGFCVRVLTRNATKATEKFGSSNPKMEVVVGQLGDGISVAQAFQSISGSSNSATSVSHVIFTAGGESADYDAVNHLGLAECAEEAQKAGTQSFVVISAAWVSKPYSLASILFNILYSNLPMARHLQGEDALRRAAAAGEMNYVILRAGRLVPDDEYPKDASMGLLYGQGDSFTFFGPAGMPGMCNTQLTDAVMTALRVEGQYTVEVTGGSVDAQDTGVYAKFQKDDMRHITSSEDTLACHQEAIRVLQIGGIVLLILIVRIIVRWSLFASLAFIVVKVAVFLVIWNSFLSDISVLDCIRIHRFHSSAEL